VELTAPLVKDPVLIRADAPESGASVLHFCLVSEERKKVDTLRRLLRLVNPQSAIVFVNHLEKVDEIVAKLNYHQIPCRLLHREAGKEERALTLEQFRTGKFPVLITTDLTARGIDIPGVECIVHFDPAADADAYVHRSGRTGRMGAAGLVFSIITPQERFILRKFEKQTGIPIAEKVMSYGALVDPQELRRPKSGPKPIHKKRRSGRK
jgi:ATP-dependent RNA helicase DeaD